MSESNKIAWQRLAIEAPVIIVSILLAFAIDAWWEERADRQAETVLLQRLQADFKELDASLAIVEEEHQWAATYCEYFMGLPLGSTLEENKDIDTGVFLVFMASRTFNPGSGAIASFHSNEGGRLIQNQALADKILAWSGLLEELQEEEANLQKGVAERWSPFIASRVALGPYLNRVNLYNNIPESILKPEVRQPLIVDEAFMNHVLDRYKWQQIALRDIKPVRSAVEEILQLIEAELN